MSSPPEPPAPHLGLALGGGGARGLCHIGVMRALGELGVHPDVVAGTSMGGLVGAFIAAGYEAAALEEIARDLRWTRLIDWRLRGRLMSTRAFEGWLRDHLPATFEELELPLVLTASNLVDGQIHYFRQGDLHTAIRATTAYPGAIEPVQVGDALLVDGGILNQLPVDGALFLGARRVIAVNATPLVRDELPSEAEAAARRRSPRSALREVFRSIDVMQHSVSPVGAGRVPGRCRTCPRSAAPHTRERTARRRWRPWGCRARSPRSGSPRPPPCTAG